jgi:hypothetical protein
MRLLICRLSGMLCKKVDGGMRKGSFCVLRGY